MQRAEEKIYPRYCENFLRKQRCYLVTTYNNIYLLQFTQRQLNELKNKHRFKRFQSLSLNVKNFWLCQEWDYFLVSDNNKEISKSPKNTWTLFILTDLTNEKVMETYRESIWQLVPIQWQYLWYEKLVSNYHLLSKITMDTPKYIIIDKTSNVK